MKVLNSFLCVFALGLPSFVTAQEDPVEPVEPVEMIDLATGEDSRYVVSEGDVTRIEIRAVERDVVENELPVLDLEITIHPAPAPIPEEQDAPMYLKATVIQGSELPQSYLLSLTNDKFEPVDTPTDLVLSLSLANQESIVGAIGEEEFSALRVSVE